jgi:hypothetical protein
MSKKCHGFLVALALAGAAAAAAALIKKCGGALCCGKLTSKCAEGECCAVDGGDCRAEDEAAQPAPEPATTTTPDEVSTPEPTPDFAENAESTPEPAAPATPAAEPAAVATEPITPSAATIDTTPRRARYGEGSFTGDTPPKGFIIKGNERSMKYHTPESLSYTRTNADVWFNSTEAAERAGFTRSQR